MELWVSSLRMEAWWRERFHAYRRGGGRVGGREGAVCGNPASIPGAVPVSLLLSRGNDSLPGSVSTRGCLDPNLWLCSTFWIWVLLFVCLFWLSVGKQADNLLIPLFVSFLWISLSSEYCSSLNLVSISTPGFQDVSSSSDTLWARQENSGTN